jgi:hypothetical protein
MTRPNSSDMSGSIWSATSSQVFSTGLFLMGMIAAQMMHARGTSHCGYSIREAGIFDFGTIAPDSGVFVAA